MEKEGKDRGMRMYVTNEKTVLNFHRDRPSSILNNHSECNVFYFSNVY
jgi:hypothetical protein